MEQSCREVTRARRLEGHKPALLAGNSNWRTSACNPKPSFKTCKKTNPAEAGPVWHSSRCPIKERGCQLLNNRKFKEGEPAVLKRLVAALT